MGSQDDRKAPSASFSPMTYRNREVNMRIRLRQAVACAAVAAFSALPAIAVEGTPKPAPRDAKPVVAAPLTQQDKMKLCNAKAKEKTLKGDERRAFMSSCLKG